MDNMKYSVLMSVYRKEKPEYLKESIESMLRQTISPDEIVLVKDGPLTTELDNVISEFKGLNNFKIVELKENVGLGKALNIGLRNCKNEIIARMDTDDISEPNRCEIQLKELVNNDKVCVLGTSVAEFIGSTDNIFAFKNVVQKHEQIIKKMKFRNPINHPTVMFKKQAVEAVGSYEHWLLNEDYYLWIRVAQKGFIFQNINEPLVKMRINNDTYLRRGGWNYFITQKKLFDYMLKCGFINLGEYVYNNIIRFGIRVIVPNKFRKLLYIKFLRKSVK